ncbi:hypothetical protein KTS45_04545 [Halomicroarcula limicola]|uniref:Uncharacterized protein n=1 Tax=Haloarcula limicola TaxID=1429915 RepID=A0A8J7Y3C9_9EURY|nr:hypothetical protein [Halomicroarcula limicola]MBV0923462.1 hypothetical protein [Halomicroarcula limicola]
MIFGFDESEFKKATASIFVVLLVTGFVPILNLVRFVPFFKEILLGAAVVAVFTTIEDTKTAIKFALVTGMIAAVAFNLIYIPGSFVLGGIMSMGGSNPDAAGGMAMLAGLGALTNIVGLIFMSPIGYTIGGALGSVLNS